MFRKIRKLSAILLWSVVTVMAIGIVTGRVSLPGQHASAQQAPECEGEICSVTDTCPNIPGIQSEVPAGYHVNDKTGECVITSTPQIIGNSTATDPSPQVLADTTGGK